MSEFHLSTTKFHLSRISRYIARGEVTTRLEFEYRPYHKYVLAKRSELLYWFLADLVGRTN